MYVRRLPEHRVFRGCGHGCGYGRGRFRIRIDGPRWRPADHRQITDADQVKTPLPVEYVVQHLHHIFSGHEGDGRALDASVERLYLRLQLRGPLQVDLTWVAEVRTARDETSDHRIGQFRVERHALGAQRLHEQAVPEINGRAEDGEAHHGALAQAQGLVLLREWRGHQVFSSSPGFSASLSSRWPAVKLRFPLNAGLPSSSLRFGFSIRNWSILPPLSAGSCARLRR